MAISMTKVLRKNITARVDGVVLGKRGNSDKIVSRCVLYARRERENTHNDFDIEPGARQNLHVHQRHEASAAFTVLDPTVK
jgi:hypothetical protein